MANKKGTVRADSALEDGGMVAVAGLDMVAAGEEVAARQKAVLEAAIKPGGHPV